MCKLRAYGICVWSVKGQYSHITDKKCGVSTPYDSFDCTLQMGVNISQNTYHTPFVYSIFLRRPVSWAFEHQGNGKTHRTGVEPYMCFGFLGGPCQCRVIESRLFGFTQRSMGKLACPLQVCPLFYPQKGSFNAQGQLELGLKMQPLLSMTFNGPGRPKTLRADPWMDACDEGFSSIGFPSKSSVRINQGTEKLAFFSMYMWVFQTTQFV